MRTASTFALALLAAALWPRPALAQTSTVPYVPTPAALVHEMLKLAAVGPADFLIDLGSGDGRIVIAAAKQFGARGFGVDIDAQLVRGANEAAARAGVADRAQFFVRDLFKTELREASVVTLYLLPAMLPVLLPKLLAELPAGARVISHDYPFASLPHKRALTYEIAEKVMVTGSTHTVLYLYVIPARVGGEWLLDLPRSIARQPVRLSISQLPSRISGEVEINGKSLPLTRIEVDGEDVSFSIAMPGGAARDMHFVGKAGDTAMQGKVQLPPDSAPWRARRR
jgi:methyltransferase family protein